MNSKTKKPVRVFPKRMMVVYGFDADGKPRAAKFPDTEFELARKAAELMGLKVHEDETAKLKPALQTIAPGNVYASGWAAIPPIRKPQYDALLARIGAPKAKAPDRLTPTGYPKSWDGIEVGHLVVAEEASAKDGWWRAVVIAVDKDMLTLQWAEYPQQPKAQRHRTAVALCCPPAK